MTYKVGSNSLNLFACEWWSTSTFFKKMFEEYTVSKLAFDQIASTIF